MAKNSFARLLASGFTSGLVGKAPGTVGTLACVIAWYLFYLVVPYQWTTTLILVLFFTAAGTLATATCLEGEVTAENDRGKEHPDPQWIVVDEWAGMLFTLLFTAPWEPAKILAAFALFRLFDISKWGPVAKAESLGGATGIMADDLVAGGIALVFLEAMTTFWQAIVA